MKNLFEETLKWFRSTFDEGVERVLVILIGICFVASLVFIYLAIEDAAAQEPTDSPVATITPTPTPTPTVDPEVQFRANKVTFCKDLVFYHYLKLTGIELRAMYSDYVATDTGAEVTGLADSADERLTGKIHFKCVYDDFMGESMMLTDFDLTEGE